MIQLGGEFHTKQNSKVLERAEQVKQSVFKLRERKINDKEKEKEMNRSCSSLNLVKRIEKPCHSSRFLTISTRSEQSVSKV